MKAARWIGLAILVSGTVAVAGANVWMAKRRMRGYNFRFANYVSIYHPAEQPTVEGGEVARIAEFFEKHRHVSIADIQTLIAAAQQPAIAPERTLKLALTSLKYIEERFTGYDAEKMQMYFSDVREALALLKRAEGK